MADTNDLDDFFKKKDRKGKVKKATGILTNNKDLLKQLEIVTSATSAFKENPNLDEEDDENVLADNTPATVIPPVASVLSSKVSSKMDTIPLTLAKDIQQEEWEEFEQSSSKIEELRAKFSRANGQDEFDDDDDEDDLVEHDENNTNTNEREQQKDKPVWKLDQVKTNENSTNNNPVEETPRPVSPVKQPAPTPAPTTGSYRPPHLRGHASGAAVTIVSGISSSGTSKKKQPNIASTEEFPTLGAAVNKK